MGNLPSGHRGDNAGRVCSPSINHQLSTITYQPSTIIHQPFLPHPRFMLPANRPADPPFSGTLPAALGKKGTGLLSQHLSSGNARLPAPGKLPLRVPSHSGNPVQEGGWRPSIFSSARIPTISVLFNRSAATVARPVLESPITWQPRQAKWSAQFSRRG